MLVGAVLGVVISVAGLAFTQQPDIPLLPIEEQRAKISQEMISWIAQQVETQTDLDFIYKIAVSLQENTQACRLVVIAAYVKLLKVAWERNDSDYTRRALEGLKSFANEIEITDISLMETLAKISQTTAWRWSEPKRLAAEILAQVELRIKLHELLDLVSPSRSLELISWARDVLSKRPTKITESKDLAPQLVPKLVDMLNSPQTALSDLAATVLAELGEAGRSALPMVITLLVKNPNRTVLATAVKKLSPVPKDQITAISNVLEKTWQDEVCASLLEALLKSGEDAEAVALDFVQRKWIRYGYTIPQAILAAIENGLQRCNTLLADYFLRFKKDAAFSKVFHRAALPDCITAAIRNEIEDCITLLGAKTPERRIEGANILAWMGPVAANAYSFVLGTLKREEVKEVRTALCKALVAIGPSEEKQVTEIMELVSHSDPEVRRAVATILGTATTSKALEHKVLDVLQKLLLDSDPHVRETAINSMVGFPEEKFVPRLIALAAHEMPDVRRIVASALGNISIDIAIQQNVFGVLQGMTQDTEKLVREAALDSLLKLLGKL